MKMFVYILLHTHQGVVAVCEANANNRSVLDQEIVTLNSLFSYIYFTLNTQLTNLFIKFSQYYLERNEKGANI